MDDGTWEITRGVKVASEMDVGVSRVGRYGVEKSLDDGGEGSWGGVVDDEGLDHGGDSRGIEGLEKGVGDELLGDGLGKVVVVWGGRGMDGGGRGGLERRHRRERRVLDDRLRGICRRRAARCIRRRPRRCCRRARTGHYARTLLSSLFGRPGSSFELAAGAAKGVLEPVVYLLGGCQGDKKEGGDRTCLAEAEVGLVDSEKLGRKSEAGDKLGGTLEGKLFGVAADRALRAALELGEITGGG